MTKFEQIGVNIQNDCTTIEEARKAFKYSCNCCCNRGMHINCDRCAISQANIQTIAILNDIKNSNSNDKTR